MDYKVEANEFIQAVRFRLCVKYPYLTSAVFALTPVPRPGLATMACDQYWRWYYDPAIETTWGLEGAVAGLFHELMHLLHEHHARCGDISGDPRLFNLAGDCEINDDLRAMGITTAPICEQWVYPNTLNMPDGLFAEQYYESLLSLRQHGDQDGCQHGGQDGGQHGGQDGGQDSGQDGGQDSGQHGDQDGLGRGRCGSCATGVPADYEIGEPGSGTPGLKQGEADAVRRQVARDIKHHSKTQGNVPAGFERWADSILTPKIPWRRVLRAAVRRAYADVQGAVDYRYAKPNRRQSAFGRVVMPALRRPTPNIAVVVDTSGSIGEAELAVALAECKGVLTAIGADGITVISCDAAVHACGRVYTPKQITPLIRGGGGTDMGAGIAAAGRLNPAPDVVIVITDGYTPWPEVPPKAKAVILLLDKDTRDQCPDWARVIEYDP